MEEASLGVARVLGVGLLTVQAGFLATGDVRAQTELPEQQMLNHVRAISAFEIGCVRDAPDFSKSFAAFSSNGMQRNENGFWVDDSVGLISGVSSNPATKTESCAVGLAAGSSEIFMRQIRTMLAIQWAGEDYTEVPSDNPQEDPSFLNDSRGDYLMLVYTSLSEAGILVMILSVTYPVVTQ